MDLIYIVLAGGMDLLLIWLIVEYVRWYATEYNEKSDRDE